MNTELESKMDKFNQSKLNQTHEPSYTWVHTRGRKFAEAGTADSAKKGEVPRHGTEHRTEANFSSKQRTDTRRELFQSQQLKTRKWSQHKRSESRNWGYYNGSEITLDIDAKD